MASWGLLQPWFLAGLAALAVPVLVHLVARAEQRGRGFPSLMFLRRIPFKARRRRTLRDRLLLLARCLALALLVSAFAGPYLEREADAVPAPSGPAAQTVVLLDRSWSMGHGERWAAAAAAAQARIDALETGAEAALITFAATAQVLQPMTADRARLRAALAGARPGAETTDIGRALAQGARSFDPAAGQRRMVLISDLQRSALARTDTLTLDAGIELEVVEIGEAPRLNPLIVAATLGQPAQPGARAPLSVRIRNHGSEPVVDGTLALRVEGHEVAAQPLDIAPGVERALELAILPPSDRAVPALLSLMSDAGEILDQHHMVLARPAPIAVVLVAAPSDGAAGELFIERALGLAHEPAAAVQRVSPGALGATGLRGADVVILHDVTPAGEGEAGALRRFVERGGSLLVVAGQAPAATSPLSAAGLIPGRLGAIVDATTRLAQLAPHPALTSVSAAMLAPAEVWRHRVLRPASTDDVLARFANDAPALAERRLGAGRSLLLTTLPAGGWSELALQPAFPPLVIELVRYLAGRPRTGAALSATVGRALDLGAYLERMPRAREWQQHLAEGGGVSAIAPGGGEWRLGAQSTVLKPAEPGIYRLYRLAAGAGPPQPLAVNVDVRERELAPGGALLAQRLRRETAPAAPATAAVSAGARSTAAPAGRGSRERIAAWWYFLAAAALLFAAEGVLAARLARRRSEAASGSGPTHRQRGQAATP